MPLESKQLVNNIWQDANISMGEIRVRQRASKTRFLQKHGREFPSAFIDVAEHSERENGKSFYRKGYDVLNQTRNPCQFD